MRITGVLVDEQGTWRIAHYHVSFLVPNELYFDLVKKIAGEPGQRKEPSPTSFPAPPETPAATSEEAVKRVLMDFARTFSEAATERCIGHLAADAMVFGTDKKERWTPSKLRAWVAPYFKKGIGAISLPRDQNVFIAPSGDLAWFDQRKVRADGGRLRSSGVLRRTKDGWRIVQMNTTIPIPNSLARKLPGMIDKVARGK